MNNTNGIPLPVVLLLIASTVMLVLCGLIVLGFGAVEEDATKMVLEMDRKQCLDEAFKVYQDEWNEMCKDLKLEKDCKLPQDSAQFNDDRLQRAEQKCFALFQ